MAKACSVPVWRALLLSLVLVAGIFSRQRPAIGVFCPITGPDQNRQDQDQDQSAATTLKVNVNVGSSSSSMSRTKEERLDPQPHQE